MTVVPFLDEGVHRDVHALVGHVPLDPYFAEKMQSLRRFESVEQALADPVSAAALTSAFVDGEMGPVPEGDLRQESVPTAVGSVSVRIYSPTASDVLPPAIVWVHGGGFAGGSIGMPESDTVARELAFLHGFVVVTVDYSFSNGTSVTYPTPHLQVTEVLRWARANRHLLGYAEGRLALGGGSAGANLAVGTVFELESAGEPAPDGLVLVYPLLHRTLIGSDSIEPELASALGPTRMTQGVVDHMFAAYTAGAHSPFASVEDHDLSRFPRTLTVLSEYDDLRPSGERFAADLALAGVDSTIYLAEGMPHGHLDRTRLVPEVGRTVGRIAQFLDLTSPEGGATTERHFE